MSGEAGLPDVVPPEVAQSLPAMIAQTERALAPASPEALAAILAKLALHYRAQTGDTELCTDYIEDLAESGFSAVVVEEATRRWRRSQPWWPKLCQLLDLCEGIHDREFARLVRLRFLLWCCQSFNGQVPRYLRSVPSPEALEALIAGENWATRLFRVPEGSGDAA